ncbi:MAG: viroplasmin family protein [bacterium]|nr:viroplasmin family protein [bacterium]
MAQKYYVVWAGRERGIFTDWGCCKAQVDGFAGARYKSYPTRAEAEDAFRDGPGPATTARRARPAGSKSTRQGPRTFTAAEVAEHPAQVKIFADGGCEPNPGRAGSGVAVYREGQVAELWYGLYNARGTNNTAELNALHQALLMAGQEVERQATVAIFCDSSYAIQCITQWASGWQKKGWQKPGGDIKNLDLIQPAFALYTRLRASVPVLHVKGHAGIEGNELADRMSIHGIDTREPGFTRYDPEADLAAVLALRKG